MTASYWSVHHRLAKERGKASDHDCVECGRRAEDWALQECASPLISTQGTEIGCSYSTNLGDYAPMCRSCHAKLDMDESKRERGRMFGREYGPSAGKIGGAIACEVTNAIKRKCLTCGKVSTPGPMTLHLRKLNHDGYEAI